MKRAATSLAGLALLVGACQVRPLDLIGRACPCPAPLVCDDAVNACVSPDAPVVLGALTFSAGVLSPPFSPEVTAYTLELPINVSAVTVTGTLRGPPATLLIEGVAGSSGVPSAPIDLHGRTEPITVSATGAGVATSYSIVPLRAHYFKPPSVDVDAFGAAIALGTSGLGETLVVGAPGASWLGMSGPPRTSLPLYSAGAVFVYVRAGSTWTQVASLTAASPAAGAQFGTSVAISGDTIAVGAPCESSTATGIDGDQMTMGATCSGAAYVFVRAGSSFTQATYLKASNAKKNDHFGIAVALSGDTLAVGAYGEESVISPSGGAYVFTRSGSTWSQQALVKPDLPQKSEQFGYALALDGETLAVGAKNESASNTGIDSTPNLNALGSGAAFVFTRGADGAWTQQAYIKPSNTSTSAAFGECVTLSGDTLVVGSPGESSKATGIDGDQNDVSVAGNGAAYVFTRKTGQWSQQAYVKASNFVTAAIGFGHSAALLGDVLVIGGWLERSSTMGVDGASQGTAFLPGSGAAYVYARQGASWSATHYLKASNTGNNDHFGAAVALSASTIAVGASLESGSATGVDGDGSARTNPTVNVGAAYAFPR